MHSLEGLGSILVRFLVRFSVRWRVGVRVFDWLLCFNLYAQVYRGVFSLWTGWLGGGGEPIDRNAWRLPVAPGKSLHPRLARPTTYGTLCFVH